MKKLSKEFEGIDNLGNGSFIRASLNACSNKVHIFSSEECADVIFTKKEAKELAKYILALCKEGV